MKKNPTSLEEFKKGTWENKSLDWAKEEDWLNYQEKMLDKSEAVKKRTAKAHGFKYETTTKKGDNGKQPVYVPPDKPVTPPPEDRPEYEGPAYVDWRTEDFSPPGMEFREVPEEERIGNIMAEYYNTKNPLYRQMTEAIARQHGTRRGTQFMETAVNSIGNMIMAMSKADQDLLSRNRELYNKGYLQIRTARLNAAAAEAAAHVAGGYQLTATKITDITNQWKAQLASDTQRYGIDVTAAVQTYITDVDKILKGADLLSKIKDNPQAVAFLYNMILGDTAIDPEEFAKYWVEKYDEIADTGTTDTGTTGGSESDFKASLNTRLSNGDCKGAHALARSLDGSYGTSKRKHWAATMYMGSGCQVDYPLATAWPLGKKAVV